MHQIGAIYRGLPNYFNIDRFIVTKYRGLPRENSAILQIDTIDI
jgi:hypothetical protein